MQRKAHDWITEEALVLLEGWARDGYTYDDIANRMGIAHRTLSKWRKEFPEIQEALKAGREIVDYKVENALLKAALGYKTKESRVLMQLDYRTGVMKAVEKEIITKEAAPNVKAAEVWLYNRLPDKWKANRQRHFEIEEEDMAITVSVIKADNTKIQSTQAVDKSERHEIDEDWVDSVNTSITVARNPEYYNKDESSARNKEQQEQQNKQNSADIIASNAEIKAATEGVKTNQDKQAKATKTKQSKSKKSKNNSAELLNGRVQSKRKHSKARAKPLKIGLESKLEGHSTLETEQPASLDRDYWPDDWED